MRSVFTRTVLFIAVAVGILNRQTAVVAEETKKVDIETESAVEYGTGGDEKLLLELARPKRADGPRPGVVFIHGGGWAHGNRMIHVPQIKEAAGRGFVAVSVGYRLAPKGTFPAQIEDCKCAVRWMRANADRLGLDPKQIGAVGFSAGAHLAMLLGTMDPKDGLEGSGGHADRSSKTQAVVAFFGPTDLTAEFPPVSREILKRFLGGTLEEKREQYRRASPATYVDASDAPMLLFQGTADNLVPWRQAVVMAEALTNAKVKGRIELFPGVGHGLPKSEARHAYDVSWKFLAETLNQP